MPKYRHVGDQPLSLPTLGLEVKPGEEFDSPEPLNHPAFELIKEKAKSVPKEKSK